jgi:hypothetical protein
VSTATPAAPAPARPAPRPGRPPALTRRQVELVRSTSDGLVPHGASRVAAVFHAALGGLAARMRPERRAAAAAQGRRVLRLLPVAAEECCASHERLTAVVAAAPRWMPEAEAAERGDEDLQRAALLRTLARVLGAAGAAAETQAAWGALCAALAAAVEEARPRRPGDALPRAA